MDHKTRHQSPRSSRSDPLRFRARLHQGRLLCLRRPVHLRQRTSCQRKGLTPLRRQGIHRQRWRHSFLQIQRLATSRRSSPFVVIPEGNLRLLSPLLMLFSCHSRRQSASSFAIANALQLSFPKGICVFFRRCPSTGGAWGFSPMNELQKKMGFSPGSKARNTHPALS